MKKVWNRAKHLFFDVLIALVLAYILINISIYVQYLIQNH